MMNSAKAKIFLADQRGCTQSIRHRSYHTFNYRGYQNKHREPFASLLTLNDETLAPGESAHFPAQQQQEVLIIPLVGAFECKIGSEVYEVDAGQFFHGYMSREQNMVIMNPYKEELINYLFLEINSNQNRKNEVMEASIEQEFNKLHHLKISSDNSAAIGIFGGRKECELTFHEGNKFLFAYIIEGAFEVNNRLLHQRDGLALWDTDRIEFEALSNNAIILVLDLQPG
jgi:quercetin 2,3-dioxygenase